MITLNLEKGRPTVEQARKRLIDWLKQHAREKHTAVKLIHGYGSTGTGGAICNGIRKSLKYRKKEGLIKDWIYGENWEIYNQKTIEFLDKDPSLRKDSDLNRKNYGITIIIT